MSANGKRSGVGNGMSDSNEARSWQRGFDGKTSTRAEIVEQALRWMVPIAAHSTFRSGLEA